MRKSRFLAALIALFLAAALPLVSTGSAQAAIDHHQVDKKKTKVVIKFKANGGKSFMLYGSVTPKGKNKFKKVTLLRATSETGKYKKFKTTKTDKKAKYSFPGLKKEGYYVTKVGKAVSGVKYVFKN